MVRGRNAMVRKIKKLLLAACLLYVTVIYQHKDTVWMYFSNTFQNTVGAQREITKMTNMWDTGNMKPRNIHKQFFSYQDIWTTRYAKLQEGCSTTKTYKLKHTQSRTLFLYSKTLKMSVCKLAKAGSTYMSIAFLAAERILSVEEGFESYRSKVHHDVQKIVSGRPLPGATAVVISRNPYSRLFSGFIDKYFLLQKPDFVASLANKSGKEYYMTEVGKCCYNVSFGNFLDMVTTTGLDGHRINAHWSPIYVTCKLCAVDYKYIIHQETMEEDMKLLFKEIDMNERTKETLEKVLHTDLTRSVKGYIKSMWRGVSSKDLCCPNKKAFLIKLWQGLQIQGYIPMKLQLPLDQFSNDSLLNEKFVTDFLLDTTRSYPMSAEERKTQRQKALVEAYRSVSKETIWKIQEMFKIDFFAFGYSVNPPSLGSTI